MYKLLSLLQLLVHGITWIFPGFQYAWLAEETKKNLPVELDFINEGHNCEQASIIFQHFDFFKASVHRLDHIILSRNCNVTYLRLRSAFWRWGSSGGQLTS